LTRSVVLFWQSIGLILYALRMCVMSDETNLQQLTSYAAVSLASPSASPESVTDMKIPVGCGRNSPVSLASYDHNTQSWKTSLDCVQKASGKSSETWPATGMMRNGQVYLLPPLVRRTSVIGSSLWPSPRASDASGGTAYHQPPSRMGGFALKEIIARPEMWPTPTANRWSGLQSHGENAILGPLNPTWVEWLMGFPAEWTDLEHSETP